MHPGGATSGRTDARDSASDGNGGNGGFGHAGSQAVDEARGSGGAGSQEDINLALYPMPLPSPALNPAVVAVLKPLEHTAVGAGAVHLETADGKPATVEREIALLSPLLLREINMGRGGAGRPVALPKQVGADVLALMWAHCRFHRTAGRSDRERKTFDERFIRLDTRRLCELTSAADALGLQALVDLASRALARLIEGKTPEEIRETFHLPDDLSEEEKLEPVFASGDDPRVRLLNRLYARKRRELQQRRGGDNTALTPAQVTAAPGVAERTVDELLSFIVGGRGDRGGGGDRDKGGDKDKGVGKERERDAGPAADKGATPKKDKKKKKGGDAVSSNAATASINPPLLSPTPTVAVNSPLPPVVVEADLSTADVTGTPPTRGLGRGPTLAELEMAALFPEDGFDDDDGAPDDQHSPGGTAHNHTTAAGDTSTSDDDLTPEQRAALDAEVSDFARRLRQPPPTGQAGTTPAVMAMMPAAAMVAVPPAVPVPGGAPPAALAAIRHSAGRLLDAMARAGLLATTAWGAPVDLRPHAPTADEPWLAHAQPAVGLGAALLPPCVLSVRLASGHDVQLIL